MISLVVAGKDLSQLVEKITWSGDAKQVARQLQFTVAQKSSDRFLPKVSIGEGDLVTLQQDGQTVFGGKIFDVEKSGSANTLTYTAFDFAYYLQQNQLSLIVDGTPEDCAAKVCGKLGITLASAAATGVKVYIPAIGRTAYEIIMAAYTKAAAKTGNKYFCYMQDIDRLVVAERGKLCGVVLDGDNNLTEASYKASAQSMVNRVVVVNQSGSQISVVENTADKAKFGTLQQIYTKEDGDGAETAAKALLKGLEQSGTVRAVPSDIRAQSGWAIVVADKVSGLNGKFYIESDTHTFTDGKSEMQLTLAFDNLMDSKDIG